MNITRSFLTFGPYNIFKLFEHLDQELKLYILNI